MIQYRTKQEFTTARIAAQPRCRQSLVERMAEDIREIGGAGLPVTEQDWSQRGYSPEIVARFAPQAQAEARRRFVRQTAEDARA